MPKPTAVPVAAPTQHAGSNLPSDEVLLYVAAEAMAMAKQIAGRQSAVTDVQRIEITTVLFILM